MSSPSSQEQIRRYDVAFSWPSDEPHAQNVSLSCMKKSCSQENSYFLISQSSASIYTTVQSLMVSSLPSFLVHSDAWPDHPRVKLSYPHTHHALLQMQLLIQTLAPEYRLDRKDFPFIDMCLFSQVLFLSYACTI